MPVGAVIAAGTAVGAIGSAAIGSSAAKKAGKLSADATDRATDLQRDQYNQTRADNEPFRQLGVGAVGQLGREFAIPGYGAQPSMTGGAQRASGMTLHPITGQPTISMTRAQPPYSGAPKSGNDYAMDDFGGGASPGAPQMDDFGYGAQAGGQPAAAGGGFDPEAYLNANPDLAAEADRVVGSDPRFPTREAYAQWHAQTYGAQEGRAGVPGSTPAQSQPPAEYVDPTAPNGYDPGPEPSMTRPTVAPRPDIGPRPTMTRPTLTRGEMAPLDVSLNAFIPSPDYQFRLGESIRGVDNAASAGGRLMSGSRGKALLERAGNLAAGEYTQWRDYTTQQYNADRARMDSNFNFDAGRADGNYNFDAARSDQNYAFDAGRSDQNYMFDANRSDANYSDDRNFAQTKFQNNRNYGAQRYDQRIGNLMQLSGMGSNANQANQNAGLAYATNSGNLAMAGANAQGQAGQAAANAWGQGFNNIMTTGAYLYGNRNGGGVGGTRMSPATWSAQMNGLY